VNDNRKEDARFAVHRLDRAKVAEDQDAGLIQQQMADGWIKFAETILRPLIQVK
jgi:hypothetical protein